ncbi:hypothetical protein [Lacibacter sediminis]|uniref:Lipocalin-like domain-containing protein n=1 Tax=Lacibacter sediminis TaxID=2760713 RepID=A0A7G5XE72_9BACT|nr:hypothetical protein [Lacibacter sediminis]QNA43775.1 hypothetical protein H4075_17075 [Lacibacter sediminis]
MRILTIFSLLIVLMSSCSTEPAANMPLAGTWQLVEIKDKSTGATLTYQPGNAGRISLSLKADGSFTGKTLKNTISGGSYTLPAAHQVNFGFFNMTEVAEDNLGSAFLTVLMSCNLQSLYPCKPSDYTISGKTILITTALRYDMKMVKL